MRLEALSLLCVLVLSGCAVAPRRPAPPAVLSGAAPDGFPATVRLVTTDLRGFTRDAPRFFSGLRKAAAGRPVNILELSGGGSAGAFGAGALVGLTQARERPRFELVTGVSAGALIAPFAFLGSSWDSQLKAAFTTEHRGLFFRSPVWQFISRLLSPLGHVQDDPLYRLVNRYVTPALLAAVARESRSGRRLIVATTDLDSQETVLWDMSAIAAQGGPAARALFRDVLVASASVPGFFPPVLIHVHEGARAYDELHVDGGVTTSVFAFPLVATLALRDIPPLRGGKLYMIVNGQLAHLPDTTPVTTLTVLRKSFSAALTYNTRETILDTVTLANTLGMHFRLTEIPVGYPVKSSVDFDPRYMRELFDYGERCAAAGLLWITPEQANRLNMNARRDPADAEPACPGPADAASHTQAGVAHPP